MYDSLVNIKVCRDPGHPRVWLINKEFFYSHKINATEQWQELLAPPQRPQVLTTASVPAQRSILPSGPYKLVPREEKAMPTTMMPSCCIQAPKCTTIETFLQIISDLFVACSAGMVCLHTLIYYGQYNHLCCLESQVIPKSGWPTWESVLWYSPLLWNVLFKSRWYPEQKVRLQ